MPIRHTNIIKTATFHNFLGHKLISWTNQCEIWHRWANLQSTNSCQISSWPVQHVTPAGRIKKLTMEWMQYSQFDRWALIPVKGKDQLSLTNPCNALHHDECAAKNKVDAQCDKLATELSWQRFAPKVVNFQLPHLHLTYPTCIWRLCWGWPYLSFAKIFSIRKLESLGYRVACLHDPMYGHFSGTLTCDRRTDIQTDRHMTTANKCTI